MDENNFDADELAYLIDRYVKARDKVAAVSAGSLTVKELCYILPRMFEETVMRAAGVIPQNREMVAVFEKLAAGDSFLVVKCEKCLSADIRNFWDATIENLIRVCNACGYRWYVKAGDVAFVRADRK